MLFIFSVLFILINLVKCPWLFGTVPGRTDYYESLSNPVMCISLLHQYPTGPADFDTAFTYHRYSNLSDNENKHRLIKYIFKKVNRRCETSVIFTTLGIDFKELEIEIKIYLSLRMDYFAEFIYKFSKGFINGIYTLTSINNNFRISVKVIDEPKDYLGVPTVNEYVFDTFDKHIKTKNDRLCVITENNKAVVLNPIFGSDTTFGYIYGLKAEIFSGENFIGERNYNAYICYIDKEYPYIPTVFIVDEEINIIKFMALYWEHFREYEELKVEFELYKPKFIDVRNLQYVEQKYNKVFLIRVYGNEKNCPDGSQIFVYRTRDNIAYFVYAKKKRKSLSSVESVRKIYRSVNDPCAVFQQK